MDRVLKFGGTSVGSPEAIRIIGEIALERSSKGERFAIVVSALSGITNQLIAAAEEAAAGKESYKASLAAIEQRHIEMVRSLIPAQQQSAVLGQLKFLFNDLEDVLQGIALLWELSKRSLDFVMAFGERFSARIIAEYLKSLKLDSEPLDARECVFCDESFGSARVDFTATNSAIASRFEKVTGITVITGFIASTPRGETVTLGRGGSDYSASIFGAALNAKEIEIWTDVDGVLTADPNKVKKAFAIPHLSYEEAMELSHFGAKVIYPPTMQPALERSIPIRIRNTFNRACDGTIIGLTKSDAQYPATGISSISSIALLRIQGSGMVGVTGVAMRVFKALAEHRLNVILITQASSEHTICIAVSPESANRAKQVIDQEFALEIQTALVEPTIVERDLCIVSVVGENMRNSPGVSGKVFGALGKNGINIAAIAQGSSELNISAVIERKHERKALNALHDGLFLSRIRTVHLFLVGPGLIGGTLLSQIALHREKLLRERHVDLQLVGVARSKEMVISAEGISFREWKNELATQSVETDLTQFVRGVIDLNLENSVFVDCTADELLAESYASILAARIPIVSPNKKIQSGELERYRDLRALSLKNNVPWLFETSVGAALPVISTLRDLLKTGDSVIKVEAVLSGTLSFIFNTVSKERRLSSVVREAMDLGLTEPDPREDLGGVDMARKILILARECGAPLSLSDITIDKILPDSLMKAPSVEHFLAQLEGYDDEFESIRATAENEGRKLRFIATYSEGAAKIALEKVTSEHPFFGLSGRDNMISFTTDRYRDRPLVVRGPGAGAEVTAAGIFADIMRLVDQI